MTRGYLVFAQGGYVELAELLAKSIKATQTTVTNISIVTDQKVNSTLFDYVIAIPTVDMAERFNWKVHNRAYSYDLSPYDETVMLDADMIFLDDVSHWWDSLSQHPLLITNKVKTYRNTWVTNSPYRKTFVSNKLPNCYSAFCYFKKDPSTYEFFELLKSIIANWDSWVMRYAPEDRQAWPSIDLGMAIAVKVLDLDVFTPFNYPTFTHMKSGCQGWGYYSERWRTHLGCYVNNGQLKLGNFTQSGILHYVDKEFNNELLHLF